MKVLVTGGCGFLGSNVAHSFLSDGIDVVIADALFRRGCESNLQWLRMADDSGTRLRHYCLDVADANAIDSMFAEEGGFDYVCHLAGQVAMTTSLDNPRRDFETNAIGTFNVLEGVRKHCPNALVAYSSTNKVYGDLEWLHVAEGNTRYSLPEHPRGLDESIPLDFASPYGCSKGCADQYVHDWYRNYHVPTVVFRHSSIYGGRQFSTFDQGWVGWFCQQAIQQRSAIEENQTVTPFTISGTGKQVRDVLHAEDLVALYRLAFDKRDAIAGKAFNVGGGMENSLSLLELFTLLEDLLAFPAGTGLAFQRQPRRQSDQDVFVANTDSLRSATGWHPRVTARDGIALMIHWIQGFAKNSNVSSQAQPHAAR